MKLTERDNFLSIPEVGFHNFLKYVYDGKSRITPGSLCSVGGGLYSYSLLEYDNSDDVISFQQFINQGQTFYIQVKFTYGMTARDGLYDHFVF